MRVLVAHASRLGSTREIAERVAETLARRGIATRAVAVTEPCDPRDYDAVVIGSAVYAGHWLKEGVEFVRRHRDALADRPVWLFSSGPVGNTATSHPSVAPAEAAELERLVGARGHRVFAGALDRSTVDGAGLGGVMGFIARHLVPEGDYRDWTDIEVWAGAIARELAPAVPV